MAWSYYCDVDGQTLVADTKEQLVEKVMTHLKEAHDTSMTREEAQESVNKSARQVA